jgi:aquaglyceroporin related protein
MAKVQDFAEKKERLDGASETSNPSVFQQHTDFPSPAPLIQAETLREHGAPIDHEIPQADVKESNPDLWWSKVRSFMIEPFSEFFGVFILILFGDGVVAQVVLSRGTKGDYQSISWGWGYV